MGLPRLKYSIKDLWNKDNLSPDVLVCVKNANELARKGDAQPVIRTDLPARTKESLHDFRD